MGEEHTQSVLKGAACANCERFPLRTLRSRLDRKRVQHLGLVVRVPLMLRQMELAEAFEKGVNLLCDSVADESELFGEDVLSSASSGPAASSSRAGDGR